MLRAAQHEPRQQLSPHRLGGRRCQQLSILEEEEEGVPASALQQRAQRWKREVCARGWRVRVLCVCAVVVAWGWGQAMQGSGNGVGHNEASLEVERRSK